jgi:tetratricopeptide (TPR) repeat protein
MTGAAFTPSDAIRRAVRAYNNGNLAEAERLCHTALTAKPDFLDGLRLLAYVQTRLERPSDALATYNRVLVARPNDAALFNNRGAILQALKRFDEALASYEQAIALKPDYADAFYNRGVVLQGLKRCEDALASYEKALAAQPSHAAALNNRGAVLRKLKRFEEALASYERLLAVRPNDVEALNNRGVVLQELKRFEDARTSYEAALAVQLEHAASLKNRGAVLRQLKRFEDALASYEQALALQPDDTEALNERGATLRELKRFEEAISSYNRVLAVEPDNALALRSRGDVFLEQQLPGEALASYDEALASSPADAASLNNRGFVLQRLKKFQEALASFERAIAIDPNLALAYWNEALLRLLLGDFEGGWRKYEWRWSLDDLAPLKRDFVQPLWLGKDDLARKTILLHAEQGFGDTIQACRYASLVAQRGARVVLEVQPTLKALMSELVGPVQVLARGEPLPAFDFHCPLMSLPLAFGTLVDTIPADVPYLDAPADRLELWNARLPRSRLLLVGLVWTGKSSHRTNTIRSIPFERLDPILSLPGIQLVSLQKDMPAADAASLRAYSGIIDLGADLRDFADTAAVVSQLDLIISVETAMAHLAGAMGKPVYIPLADSPDWRWLLTREDSPWYPTARLFRQQQPGNWSDVIRRIVDAIAVLSPTPVAPEPETRG